MIFLAKYTSFQYNGNSVVVYCIVSEDLIEDVIYFHVHDHLPHLSDHAKLSLKLSVSVANFSFSAEKDTTYDMPSSYIGGLKILLFYFKKRLIRLM